MNFVEKRIKEIREHKTLGDDKPDLEQLKPMLDDIAAGNYHKLAFAYESKDGLQVIFTTKDCGALITEMGKQSKGG